MIKKLFFTNLFGLSFGIASAYNINISNDEKLNQMNQLFYQAEHSNN